MKERPACPIGALPLNSPSPVPEISLANPVAVESSLAYIDQAALSLMVISEGAMETTQPLERKEGGLLLEGAVVEHPAVGSGGEALQLSEKSEEVVPVEVGELPGVSEGK